MWDMLTEHDQFECGVCFCVLEADEDEWVFDFICDADSDDEEEVSRPHKLCKWDPVDVFQAGKKEPYITGWLTCAPEPKRTTRHHSLRPTFIYTVSLDVKGGLGLGVRV